MGHEVRKSPAVADVRPRPASPLRRVRRSPVDSRPPRATASIGLRNPSTRPAAEVPVGPHSAHAGQPAEAPLDGRHHHWPHSAHLQLERPRPAIALALVGGERLLRDATASLLTAQDGLHVLGTFASAEELMQARLAPPPAVILLDGDGPHGERTAALEQLRRIPSGSRVVLLCRSTSEELVRCAIEHRAGGVLLKSYSTADLLAALAYTVTGRTVLPAGWQRSLPSHPGTAALSRRHRQILALIAAGRRNEEIAADLELSPNTIKFHIRALYSRLGVRNRVEAANQYAQMAGGDA